MHLYEWMLINSYHADNILVEVAKSTCAYSLETNTIYNVNVIEIPASNQNFNRN